MSSLQIKPSGSGDENARNPAASAARTDPGIGGPPDWPHQRTSPGWRTGGGNSTRIIEPVQSQAAQDHCSSLEFEFYTRMYENEQNTF